MRIFREVKRIDDTGALYVADGDNLRKITTP